MLINKKMLNSNGVYYFPDLNGYGRNNPVEDDHVPFLKKSNFIFSKIYLKLIIN